MWIFRPFFAHRRWPKLRFDVENREENVIKHVYSPSGDMQIIFLIEWMQTAIYCEQGISAHTPISRFRKTNEIWEQWYDFVPRAGWAAVWWGIDEWRKRSSLSCIEVERRESIMRDGMGCAGMGHSGLKTWLDYRDIHAFYDQSNTLWMYGNLLDETNQQPFS